jgi:hypothetical protein
MLHLSIHVNDPLGPKFDYKIRDEQKTFFHHMKWKFRGFGHWCALSFAMIVSPNEGKAMHLDFFYELTTYNGRINC